MTSRTQWANEAVAGIILPKERESARQELLDHMEDHRQALLSAGVPREEAERQALAAMGDAQETARLLRRVHQPILTRLMQAARVTAVCLAVVAALSVFFAWVKQDPILPGWYEGRPYAEDQAWFFEQPVDGSILYRRVCEPKAALPVGDYTLRVDKAAVVRYADRWEVHLLTEFDGKWPWQDTPVVNRKVSLTADGTEYEVRGTDPRGHRNGGSHFGWFYAEIPGDINGAVLEIAAEDRTYSLRVDLRGGEVYEKAH